MAGATLLDRGQWQVIGAEGALQYVCRLNAGGLFNVTLELLLGRLPGLRDPRSQNLMITKVKKKYWRVGGGLLVFLKSQKHCRLRREGSTQTPMWL